MSKWVSYRQLWLLFVSLFREIIREPGVLFWGILFPVLMALGLGIAFAKKSDVVRKIAIIESVSTDSLQYGNNSLGRFLHNSCETNSKVQEGEWKWSGCCSTPDCGSARRWG